MHHISVSGSILKLSRGYWHEGWCGAPAGQESQLDVLRSSGFSERTPLWYYILAEAAFHAKGKHLGPVGSTLVAEVLIGLILKSENSILRNRLWEPTLPMAQNGKFTLADLLRFAGVLG
jgi:hypothetical protein